MGLQEKYEFINQVLEIHGDNTLSIESIKTILKLCISIAALQKHRITSKNYTTKCKAYDKFCEKAFDEYGIQLPSSYPFSNPTELYEKIHKILESSNLNEEQITEFYKNTKIREKAFNIKHTNLKKIDSWLDIEDIKNNSLSAQIIEDNDLTIDEILKITGISKDEYFGYPKLYIQKHLKFMKLLKYEEL